MIRRPPRSTQSRSSAASDVYKRQVQALLEAAGLAYTGSGVLGSAVGMDKVVQKRIWRGLGLRVIDWREVHATLWRRAPDQILGELEAFAGTDDARLMIKPSR